MTTDHAGRPAARAMPAARERPRAGRVVLCGAGPGDPDLLTVKALRALKQADVILHDALVPAAVLREAQATARLVEVGKRGGCASTPQAFIEQLMVREARAGNVVVRLKGGDPFIFGRGGEEIETLRAAGIPVEVIPGVTAASAAAAAVGAPLTHRAHTRGVAFVTGHSSRIDQEPDWHALAASGLTLAIYMGAARAAAIVAQLIAAGVAGDVPVVIVANASRPQQSVITGPLARIAAQLAQAGRISPAVMLVGRSLGVDHACARAAEVLRSGAACVKR